MIQRSPTPVVIPAYQAAPSVAQVVRSAREFCEEVVVVDDGSSDDTGVRAAEAGARILRHPKNLGKGRALKTAFADLFAHDHLAVITMDADGQHLASEIPKLLGLAARADLVIGSRNHLYEQFHRVRRAGNRLSSAAISVAAGQRLPDVQSGFRLYGRRLVERVGFPEPRFEAETAVVLRAARLGFRIAFVPIELGFADGRTTSHYRPIVDSVRIARAVVRARLEVARCRHERFS